MRRAKISVIGAGNVVHRVPSGQLQRNLGDVVLVEIEHSLGCRSRQSA